MQKFFRSLSLLLLWCFLGTTPLSVAHATPGSLDLWLSGRILLQVEQNGEAWYLDPADFTRFYLGRPDLAFEVMRNRGRGVSNETLLRLTGSVPAPQPGDQLSLATRSGSLRDRLIGAILLQVERNGEAYYFNPHDARLTYLGRPSDAFRVMRSLGLGITDTDLARIPVSDWSAVPPPKRDSDESEKIGSEPLIRTQITEDSTVTRVRANGAYSVTDGSGAELMRIPDGSEITITRTGDAAFAIATGAESRTAQNPVRLIPSDSVIMEIANYERRPTWNPSLNDNRFRGMLEVHIRPNSEKWWVINELPLESYLRGLGEVNESQPLEHIKTMITAARTYAQYHILNDKKHPNEPFHLNNTSNDQVYLGYGFEQRAPTVSQAVEQTRGMTILYSGKPIVAAYSCCTDGRTRSWKERWGSDGYPYAQSVPDPLGFVSNASSIPGNHMVGISARGAEVMARDGKNFTDIIAYYYAGVEVKKQY